MAVADDHQAAGEIHDHFVVGGEDKSDALGLVHFAHHLQEAPAGLGIQVGGGFVGQHDGGVRHNGPGHRHPLLLAAGKLPRPAVILALQDLKLVKSLTLTDIKPMGGRLYPATWRMQKADTKGKYTVVGYEKLEFKDSLPESRFTLSNLRNPRF